MMFQRPDRHRSDPTDFSVIPKPPNVVSAISHNGTASYMEKVAKPLAKRMMRIIGIGHRKITDLEVSGMDGSDSTVLTSLTVLLGSFSSSDLAKAL